MVPGDSVMRVEGSIVVGTLRCRLDLEVVRVLSVA